MRHSHTRQPSISRRDFLARCGQAATVGVVAANFACADAPAATSAALIRRLNPLSVRGINYYPAQTPWGDFWTKTPSDVIERDMELAASLNVNAVRTFVHCSEATHEAKLTDTDGNVSQAYLDRFEHFLSAAWGRGIRTVACFDFDENTLSSAEGSIWRRAMRAFITRCRLDGRVLMWDLMNEPEGRHWDQRAQAYLKSAIPYCKELDGEHLSTVGIAWEIDRLAALGMPDVIQYHEYAPKRELFESGVERVGTTIEHMEKTGGDRPLIIGEFGMSTARDPVHGAPESQQSRLPDAPGTEKEQARLYTIVLDAAAKYRIAGVIPWCLHSYPTQENGFLTSAESMFGLIRRNGTLKPAAELLKERFGQWTSASH